MYVCICHAFTVDDIQSQIRAGNRSVNKIGRSCGAGGDCGACVKKIQEILKTTVIDDGKLAMRIAG